MLPDVQPWYRYWGKARPLSPDGDRYHLLVYHCLDVAACGQALVALPRFSLQPLSEALGWPREVVDRLFVYFLALHDVGKFAPSFQNLARGLSSELVSPDLRKRRVPLRHDVLGWLLWCKGIARSEFSHAVPDRSNKFWQAWVRTAMGHHGVPPDGSGGHGVSTPLISDYFPPEDQGAALAFDQTTQSMFFSGTVPSPTKSQWAVVKGHSWMLAGLTVLADWLGSAQRDFPYRSSVIPLDQYWSEMALPAAEAAVARAGFVETRARRFRQHNDFLAQLPLRREWRLPENNCGG